MGAAARRGRSRHRARRQRRPARRRARRRRRAARGGAGRRRPSPRARLGTRRCAVGGDRRVLRSELLDPHGSDAITDGMRVHAAAALHASGPLPTIRLGPQPYGVLPGRAPAVGAAPGLGRSTSTSIGSAGCSRSMWEEQLDRVPRLGRVGETQDVDDVLLELLQRTPVPWELRWREMVPPPQWTASEWLATFRAQQAPWLYDVTDRLDIPPNRPARIQYLTASPDSHPLGVPLVAKGDAGTSYVAEIAALARQGDEGRRELNLRQNSIALLEALLAFAAVQELDKAASAELVDGLTVERSGGGRLRAQGRPHPRPRPGGGARPAAARRCSSRRHERSPRRPLPAPRSRCTTRWRRRLRQRRPARAHRASRRARSTGWPGSSPRSTCSRRHRPTSWSGRSGACSTCSAPASTPGSRPSPPPASPSCGRSGRRASTSGATAGSRTSGPTVVRPPTASATSPRRRWRTP